MNKIIISDPTLRDGNHAVKHQLRPEDIVAYCTAAENANVPIIEVGHGNGLGASSILVGEGLLTDFELLEIARNSLKQSKLSVHAIPGFCTINKHIKRSVELGVDIFRLASHCTEADVTQRHIEYVRKQNKEAYGVLMMSHMATPEHLVSEAKKMQNYGAEALIIMDSAGAFLPNDVTDRILRLVNELSVPVGFHGHNNLGMAVANSIAAVNAGATILDGTIRGFGGGAGNTQLEVLIAVLHKMGYETGINLYKILDAATVAEAQFNPIPPYISPTSVISGISGVVSVFSKQVDAAAKEYNVDPRDIFIELGRRKSVAGQENLIIEVAQDLARNLHA